MFSLLNRANSTNFILQQSESLHKRKIHRIFTDFRDLLKVFTKSLAFGKKQAVSSKCVSKRKDIFLSEISEFCMLLRTMTETAFFFSKAAVCEQKLWLMGELLLRELFCYANFLVGPLPDQPVMNGSGSTLAYGGYGESAFDEPIEIKLDSRR